MVQVIQTGVTKQPPGLPPVPFTGFRDTATAQTSKKTSKMLQEKVLRMHSFPKTLQRPNLQVLKYHPPAARGTALAKGSCAGCRVRGSAKPAQRRINTETQKIDFKLGIREETGSARKSPHSPDLRKQPGTEK